MKKALCLLLVCAILLALPACGGSPLYHGFQTCLIQRPIL